MWRHHRDTRGRHSPVLQLLSDGQVLQVVVDGLLVVLQQGVRVAEAVAGLRLHGPVLQLPGQQQRLSEEEIRSPENPFTFG